MSTLIAPYEEKYLEEVREIFFESSTRKEFKSDFEKEAFFMKYVGYYLKYFPELALIAIGDRVLGYIVGAPETNNNQLFSLQPHLEIFRREFQKYPAHLHINCHHESRGKGVGAELVKNLEERLKDRKISGVHIITGADAENKKFYKKLGFDHEVREEFEGAHILLMGKILEKNKL